MTTATLLTRASGVNQLNQIGDFLKLSLEGLRVEAKILGTVAGGWVQVALSGEDEGVATRFLAKEIGFCPISFGNLGYSTLRGYVTSFEKSTDELAVDIGVFQPKINHATIPLNRLQIQLMAGKKVALRKMGELFGFCEGLPLSIKVTHMNEEKCAITAELSTQQVEKYKVWQEALLDKLLALGATLREVEDVLERLKLNRDIIHVEPLGILAHALTCKLGTDAAGLIPKIGRILKNVRFAVVNPRKIGRFLES